MIYIKQRFILIAVYIFIFAIITIDGRCILQSEGDNQEYCEISKNILDSTANKSTIYRNDFKTTTISYQTSKSVESHNSNNNTSCVANTTAGTSILSNRMLKYNLKYLKGGHLLQKFVQPKYVLSVEGGKTNTVIVDKS